MAGITRITGKEKDSEMKTAGLILTWFAMTFVLIFWYRSIENVQSFLTIYVLLGVYLVCIVGQYIKKKE